MVIGFLGKGGSGKSTFATLTNNFLINSGKKVIAVDADHNMDLAFNLLGDELESFDSHFGSSYEELQDIAGFNDIKYDEFVSKQSDSIFRISPADDYTSKYVEKIGENQYLMVAGEHNQEVLHGQKCSHSLATPLKAYLPLLELGEDEFVVIDYLAGSDGAATGIVTGMDYVVVVVEDTPHSVKAAKQITELLEFFSVPYGYAVNKDNRKDRFLDSDIQDRVIFKMPSIDIYESNFQYDMSELLKAAETFKHEVSRLERSKNKFIQNLNY